MKTWFITGISRGLGHALAQAALSRGDRVVGTVRGKAPDLRAAPEQLRVLTLDMADVAAVTLAVEQAFAWAGRVDIIVNNAGYGLLGSVEQASEAEVARLFAVDVFGPFQLIRVALPRLRAQGNGHIVNVTSIAGRAPSLGSAFYAAAKHALEGLSAGLAQEVAPLGIKVTAVAPGAFRTDFMADHSIQRSAAPDAAYADSVGAGLTRLNGMIGRQIGDPERAARAVLTLVDDPNPPVHLLLGSDALGRAKTRLAQIQEDMAVWERVTLSTDFPAA